MMDLPMPECLVDIPCGIGENPLWHPDEQRIYWTDISGQRLYRCAADGDVLESFEVPSPVGGFTVQEDGALALFMGGGAVRIWRDGQFLETIMETVPGEEDGRFNDVIAGIDGSVYCGTMSTGAHAGRFYRLHTDRRLERLVEGMGTPNGMGYSPDRRWFYQNDSRLAVMYRWAHDPATGDIHDRQVLIDVDKREGVGRPDGMIVDAEGFLWTARWDGHRVIRHSPDGIPVAEMVFPTARNVSSLTLAGPDMTMAFVTTAACGDRERNGPEGGALFVVKHCPVHGQAEFRSRL
ncbi:MAG: SMP-30/gluconolactonase/LRE family protein [Lentisphaeria bacterium]|nr:SMP-30/gluconolactonase/LRE family protein [Lentisphaeria bacterium]